MKILLIHNFYQFWGGEDSYITSLKELLESKGHKVIFYAKHNKQIKSIWDKIKVAIGLFWNPQVYRELTEIIQKENPDVAHFNNIYPLIGSTAYRVCKKYDIPIIQHIHNYRFMCPKGILFRNGEICELCVGKKLPFHSIFFGCYHGSRFASLFFSFAFFFHKITGAFDLIDTFIFPSEFTNNYYQKNLDIPKKKVAHISHFVETEQNPPEWTKRKDHFLYIGRLSEEKGIIQLLEIFKTMPKLMLAVIGDGPLRKKVKQYQKYSNISIIGFLSREKAIRYIQQAKAIIISSIWYEALPFVYIEAIKQNVPIIVPDNINFKLLTQGLNNVYKYKFTDFIDLKKVLLNLPFRAKSNINLSHLIKYSEKYHYTKLINLYNMLQNENSHNRN